MDQAGRAVRFEQWAKVYGRFVDRVAALYEAAWDRLIERTAVIDGPSFDAVVRRAQLGTQAMAFDISRPSSRPLPIGLRAFLGATYGLITTMQVVGELVSEFETVPQVRGPFRRTTSTGNPARDARLDAYYRLEEALLPYESHAGLCTAVRAAGMVVPKRDFISETRFNEVYGFIEPEIPYASIAAD